MFLTICFALGVSVVLYALRKKFKRIILILHYETVYWILGCASMIEDFLCSKSNVLPALPDRSNEVAVVTGGSRGIGFEVVRKLLQCNMHVIIGCRKVQAGLDAISLLREQGVTSGTAEVEQLDTSSLKSVETFAKSVLSKVSSLHLLINNAGIMFVPHSLTEDGFESHFGVNYMGHVLLTHLLLPKMKETGRNSDRNARIVHVSSCAHIPGAINFSDINFTESVYIPSEAYAQSKLAQLMFSCALERRLKQEEAKVSSFAVHPGIVNTELFNKTTIKYFTPWVLYYFFKTPEQGCRPIVFTAISETLEGRGGLYISNCREAWISLIARNTVLQEKLMKKTLEMLKLKEIGHPE